MRAIVCVDDNFGMLFNKRRQSRDQMLLEDIFKNTQSIMINPFSEKLFVAYGDKVTVDEDFLNNAGKGDVCFVEDQTLTPYLNKIEELILYKWNRKYPADFCLDICLQEWEMIKQEEFSGKSHEKITKETYVRSVK